MIVTSSYMNITHSSKPNDSNTKLDLRFADDEDAEEIANVVNQSHLVECVEGGKYQMRNDGPRITVEEIISDCSQASCRWIVLETPRPEELVVAAVRLLMIPKENKAIIDLICSIPLPNNISEVTKSDSSEPFSGLCRSISSQLLAKTENIARGHGMDWLIIEVSQYREDIMDWVSECGYEDKGGHMWPSNKPCGSGLSKPCMLLEFQKDLRIRSINDENSRMLFPISLSSNSTKPENKINNNLTNKISDIPFDDSEVEAQIFSTGNDDEYDTDYNSSTQTFSTFDFQDFANVLDVNIIDANDVIQVPRFDFDNINMSLHPNTPSIESASKDGSSILSNELMGSNEEMNNLVSTLFRALHAENNEGN